MSDDREAILDAVGDLVVDFVLGKHDDGDLSKGAIEKAIEDGDITIDDIVDRFREELEQYFEEGDAIEDEDDDDEDDDDDEGDDDEGDDDEDDE